MAFGLKTFQDTVKREDLLDYITNVDYTNTPLYSGLGTATAQNTIHQWPVDILGAAADNGVIEGSDPTYADHTQPTKITNLVQIFRKPVQVSDTERAVNIAGMTDAFNYQLKKASKEIARDIELTIVQGTLVSGQSGVPAKLNGCIAQISTNKTARDSGTSLTPTEFNDVFKGIFENGTDEVANETYVGSYLKRVISQMTVGDTKYREVKDKRIWDTVSVYESDFGETRIYLSRYIPSGGLLAINPEFLKIAYLTGRTPKYVPLAKTGSSTKGMIEGELTLEVLAEQTAAYRSGLFVG